MPRPPHTMGHAHPTDAESLLNGGGQVGEFSVFSGLYVVPLDLGRILDQTRYGKEGTEQHVPLGHSA